MSCLGFVVICRNNGHDYACDVHRYLYDDFLELMTTEVYGNTRNHFRLGKKRPMLSVSGCLARKLVPSESTKPLPYIPERGAPQRVSLCRSYSRIL